MRNRNIVLFLCCAIYILSFFHRNSSAVIASDLMADLGFSPASLSMVSGGTMLAYGLMQVPSGILTDIFGGKKVIVCLTIFAALCTACFAFSTGQISAVASRFFLGIGIAMTVPAFALLARVFPPESYSRALSIFTACGGLGAILAAPPLVWLSTRFGWRLSVLFFAALTLLTACFFLFIVKDKEPKKHTAVNGKKILAGIGQVLGSSKFWPLCLWQMFMTGTVFMLLTLWWIPYLTETAALSRMEAANILTIASLCILAAQPLTATLSDVVFKNRRILLLFCTLLSLIGALMMTFLTGKMNLTVLILQTVLLTVGSAGGSVLMFTMVKESFPPSLVGTAMGCCNMFFPIWTALMQSLFGIVLQWQTLAGASPSSAYSSACLIILANVLLGLVCAWKSTETYGNVLK